MAEEKIFNVPLREAYKKTKVHRAPYASSLLRAYIKKHMKADEVKMGRRLNNELWAKGTKKPPHSIRVKAVMEGKVAKAELLGFDYEEFKAAPKKESKGMKEKLMERLGPKALQKQEEEKMADKGKTAEEIQKEGEEKKA